MTHPNKPAIVLLILSLALAACTPSAAQTTSSPAVTVAAQALVPTTQKSEPLPTLTSTAEDTAAPPILSLTPSPAPTASPQVTAAPGVIDLSNVETLTTTHSLQVDGAMQFTWLAGASPALAVGTAQEIAVYSPESPDPVASVPAGNPAQLASASSQSKIAWSEAGGVVKLWDGAPDSEPASFEGSYGEITSLALAPAGDLLAAAGFDNGLSLWDTTSGDPAQTWDLPSFLANLAFSPDGSRLAGIDPQSFSAHIFDLETREEVHSLTWEGHASPVLYGAFFSPDWTRLAWVARGTVQLVDAETGEPGPSMQHEDFVSDLAWSPDGALIVTLAAGEFEGSFSPLILIWDAATGEPAHIIPLVDFPISVEFSPAGDSLAVLLNTGEIQLWSPQPTQ